MKAGYRLSKVEQLEEIAKQNLQRIAAAKVNVPLTLKELRYLSDLIRHDSGNNRLAASGVIFALNLLLYIDNVIGDIEQEIVGERNGS